MNALKPTPPFQVLIMSEESRLGREAIETAYALKQLMTSGVRVFFSLEDRERTLDKLLKNPRSGPRAFVWFAQRSATAAHRRICPGL